MVIDAHLMIQVMDIQKCFISFLQKKKKKTSKFTVNILG